MAVIKVETFDVDISANGSTHTLTNDVGNVSNAFVKINSSTDKGSGRTTSTGNLGPVDTHMGVRLTGTNQLTFNKGGGNAMKKVGEVWRYTGPGGGADEFITRGRYAISLTGISATQAVAGIVDRNKVVPFLTGVSSTSTSVNNHDSATVGVRINGSGDLVVSRGVATIALTVYVEVVEFTGTNWKIGHGVSVNHDVSSETVVLNEDSTGAGGIVFDVGDWSNAFIEASMEGDTVETGLSDNLGWVVPGANTTEVVYDIHQDGNARNESDAFIHVIVNSAMQVYRNSNTNFGEGNGTYTNAPWPAGAPTNRSLDELALEWFSDTTGTGTAHARGRLNTRITAASGTIQTWVHRSGNNVGIWYGVIDLTNVNNVATLDVTDVDGDEQITNTQTAVQITGIEFGAAQGTGKVELVQNSDYSGTMVLQSANIIWTDTLITVDIAAGLLSDSNCFLYVTNDSGARGYKAVRVGAPALDALEVILATGPDHLHPLDGNYTDVIAGSNLTQNVAGSPSFVSDPLLRGLTQSLLTNNENDKREQPDSIFTNVTTQHTDRDIILVIKTDRFYKKPVHIIEEGGGINNLYKILGAGNKLLGNAADSSKNFKVQAIHDTIIEPNRIYVIGMHMYGVNGAGGDGRLDITIDGEVAATTIGNPIVTTTPGQSTHSGDRSILAPDGSLDTGGVDITYVAPVGMQYQMVSTYSAIGGGSPLGFATVKSEWVDKCVPARHTIATDTEANMQTALNLVPTTLGNHVCSIEVFGSTDGDITLDNIGRTFDAKTTLPLRYWGVDTLTWVNRSGGSIDESKIVTPNGGTVIVLNEVTFNFQIQWGGTPPADYEYRIYVDDPAQGIIGTVELQGAENETNTSIDYGYLHSVDQNVRVQVIAEGYLEGLTPIVILTDTDQSIIINMNIDTNL